MTDHPLTDAIIIELVGEKDFFPCLSEEDMRIAADWQLEQVIEWLYDNLYWVEEDGSLRYISGEMVSIDHHQIIEDLKEAMRPQQHEE